MNSRMEKILPIVVRDDDNGGDTSGPDTDDYSEDSNP